MSLDNSLRMSNQMARHRNVLTRAERVERLRREGKFDLDKDNPIGLPKVGNRKIPTGKK
jgi:small basic protein (TIGR04137 family)